MLSPCVYSISSTVELLISWIWAIVNNINDKNVPIFEPIDPKINSVGFSTPCATDFATGHHLQAQCLYIKSLFLRAFKNCKKKIKIKETSGSK